MWNITLPIAEIQVSVFALFVIGFCAGVLGGFFGVGGAWIVTPALNIFGFPMSYAIGTDLAHIFGKSIIATQKHSKMGNVDIRLGLFAIAGSVIGMEIGAQTIMWLTKIGLAGEIVRWLYIILLFSLAVFMFYDYITATKSNKKISNEETPKVVPKIPGKTLAQKIQELNLPPFVSCPTSGIKKISIWIITLIFLVLGFLSGFLGVGGGFITVPALIYLLSVPTVVAVGTSLFTVLFKGGYGCFTYAMKGRVEILAALIMLCGAAIGAQIGVTAVKYIRGYGIRLLFAIMTFFAAISVLLKQATLTTLASYTVIIAASCMSLIIIGGLIKGIKKEKKLIKEKIFTPNPN